MKRMGLLHNMLEKQTSTVQLLNNKLTNRHPPPPFFFFFLDYPRTRLHYATESRQCGSVTVRRTWTESSTAASPVSRDEPLLTLIKTNDKECLLGFHDVFCIINLINCIVQNKWAE